MSTGLHPQIESPAKATTLSNAPLATYPAGSATSTSSLAATNATTQPTTAPQTSALANVPATGPYDPNGYRPSASPGALASGTIGGASTLPDRYASAVPGSYGAAAAATTGSTIGTSLPVSGDRYSLAPSTTTSTTAGPAATTPADPYANSSSIATSNAGTVDRYGPTTATPNMTAATPQPSVPPIEPAVAAASSAASTVQLSSPLGQYRPGGTSSYSGAGTDKHLEIATRPTPPAQTNAPAATASPPRTSDPWSPPATAPSATRAF
jgi:hypothetical protein